MNKKWFLLISCSTFGFWASAQSLSPSVLAVDGAESSTPNLSLEWTVGELMVAEVATTSGQLTEGFHQPLLSVVKQATPPLLNQAPSNTTIEAWPNPVHTSLYVKIENPVLQTYFLKVVDVTGRELLHQEILAPFELMGLDFSSFAPGTYFVQFFNSKQLLIQSFVSTKH